jgi:nickel-type superoxide dismutase maturation protease
VPLPWQLARVSGESMTPSLRDGDFVLLRKGGEPQIGSVVVAVHPEHAGLLIVKRLAGGPGDAVYGAPLGRDDYWLTSDNLQVSPDDSRSFGPVPASAIVGRVVRRYWRSRRRDS